LDPSVGEFLLSHPDIKIPPKGNIYSVNEANSNKWDKKIRDYIETLKDQGYTSRYIGSLVSDFHRNLLKGGVFLYPADEKNKKGKLRLLYEAFPLSYIVEHAGGASCDGLVDILDKTPQTLHDRTPLIIGSKYEVDLFKKMTSI
ncbi:MAG: class 1 fructose-bisphosphatase, partial [Desulfurella sp.]